MLDIDIALRRAQVYRFLGDAFLYPSDNWLEDLPALEPILRDLDAPAFCLLPSVVGHLPSSLALSDLQAEHRRAFGLTGSQCYETEFGLPHEFRQSQELADIAGFYRAFGFTMGGRVRERPDHLAAELEFMHVLALKEAYARANGLVKQTAVCEDAQRKFLQDHLGRWIGPFAESLARSALEGPYVSLAAFMAAFGQADARRLGAQPEQPVLADVRPTPLAPDLACESCPVLAE
jgi:DMSO reductase family type II enzyme chaperone